ncbi:hypothetical protein KZ813_19935, partial [Sphingomonas sp. RHCKR7]|uniref:hypothetical protein n=1 Tax=Sphingomonas folli TaxID=2862497 RepID=UPI001CA58CDA
PYRPAAVMMAASQAGHTEAPEPARSNLPNTPLYPVGRPHTDAHSSPRPTCVMRRKAMGLVGFWQVSRLLSGRQPPLPKKMIGDDAEPDEEAKRRADEK